MPSFEGVGDWLGQPVSGLDWFRQPVTGPSWLRILAHLIVSPKTPTELANLERKHLSEVSRTLRSMRDSGLVEFVDTGSRERYYRATEEGLVLFRRSLR